jgi:hypothetical protein
MAIPPGPLWAGFLFGRPTDSQPTLCIGDEPVSKALRFTGRPARPAILGASGPSRRRVLLGDLDDPLHPQLGVTAPILGVHEAHLDVDTRLGGDRLLLESFV